MRVKRSVWALAALTACSASQADPKPTTADADRGPIIVELFTSQGCSSCPPADRLLASLARDPAIATLSFHVDYWNDLGWADPYSQPAWTDRQHAYARALGDTRVYTPELVIDGAIGMVGSQTTAVRDAITKAVKPARLDASATWSASALEVTARAPSDGDVWVAVWETERTVKVTRGENAGATLSNSHVVRRLERIAAAGRAATATIKLDPSWREIGAVAFAQRPDRRITASARLTH